MGEFDVKRKGTAWALGTTALLLASNAFAATLFEPLLRLTVEQRYDDDRTLRTGSNPVGEFRLKTSPQIGGKARSPTLDSEIWYAADLFWLQESAQTRVDHRGALNFKKRFTPRLTTEARLGIWRVTDPTSLPRLGVAATLSRILYGRADLSASLKLSSRWTSRLSYRFEGVRIYAAGREPGYAHTPSLEAWYGMSTRTALGVEARFQAFQFQGPDAVAFSPALGFRTILDPITTLSLKVGSVVFQRLREPGETGDTPSGVLPRVNFELTRQGPRFGGSFLLGHDLVGSSAFVSVVWADYVSLSGTAMVGRYFKLLGTGSYFRNGVAPNTGVLPWNSDGPSSEGYALIVGLEWMISQNVSIQALGQRIQQINPEVIPGASTEGFVRNIAAVRFMLTAW